MIETTTYKGKLYCRIDPDTIDLATMGAVQKVADVYACQVQEGGRVRYGTASDAFLTAHATDWVVYNIGNGDGSTLQERLESCTVKILPDSIFRQLYRLKQDEDSSDYSDYSTIEGGNLFTYTGKSVYAARVPFDFVIQCPWGEDHHIEAGGYVIYNPHISYAGKKDIYGITGAHHRHAGSLEKTYTLVGDGDDRTMSLVYRHVIACDRSPLPGIQFTYKGLQEAYAEHYGTGPEHHRL